MPNISTDPPYQDTHISSAPAGGWSIGCAHIRHPQLLDALVFIWALLTAVVLSWLFHARGYDDPYITYRYAVNLADGVGFVYNAGERVLSTTTPLYALLLAVAGLAGLDVLLASNVIGCLSLALGGLAFWRLGQVWNTPVVGVIGLVLYPTFPFLIFTLGAESALYITLILFGFLACAREQYGRAAMLLAFATLTRADGALAAAAAGVYVLLVSRHRPWRAILIYGALLAPWFVFAWFYFGAPLPATLAAKQQQGLMAISRGFWDGLITQAQNHWSSPFYRLHFVLAAIGLSYALARRRRWLLLLGWNALYVAGYAALGVAGYFWYYAPLAAGFIALAGLGGAAVHRLIEQRGGPRWAAGTAVALLLALFAAQVGSLAMLWKVNDSRMVIYRTAGEWLRDHTPSDASVGTLEVGIIGYYAQRRMIDFAGLLQPETATRLTPVTTYEDAALWAVHHFHPDYLVLQEHIFPRLEQDPALMVGCRSIEAFKDSSYPSRLIVYKCAW
jgi:hypothetical protein